MADLDSLFDNLALFNFQSAINNYEKSQPGKLLVDLNILPAIQNYSCVSNCGGLMD